MDEKLETVNDQREKTKKKKGPIVLLLLLLILGISLYFGYYKLSQVQEIYKDQDAKLGILPDMTEEEIQQRLNAVVSEGMMNISMNPHPVYPNGKAPGTLRIENIEQNHYSYQVNITLDDTGEEIYKSGLLEPGYFIEEGKLIKPLKKGDYKATARFLAYQDIEDKPIGAAVLKITITVEN